MEDKNIEKLADKLADYLQIYFRLKSSIALEYLDVGYEPFKQQVIQLMKEKGFTNKILKYQIRITLRFAGLEKAPVKLSYIPPNYRECLLDLMRITTVINSEKTQ